MREIYTKPQAEIEEFKLTEVLTLSTGNENGDGGFDNDLGGNEGGDGGWGD